ncbi:hypothetical protein ACIBAI_05605 [Streptomyces sp. NPDC051041]|uniref:hypothetical protein n=1 Tax=Streptomyces sp. NPDC051041 TaxID=3365640 RepID=UPI0037AB470D
MIGNLFTVAEWDAGRLRRVLADLLAVPDEEVDVADADADQEGRRWEAPVLCTYRRLPPGDLALELDVTVGERAAGGLTEEGLAHGVAAGAGGSVLYPSDLDLPSAYWIAVPDGRAVRCRLEAVETGEDTAYRVDAVEEPVADLPGAHVGPLPEVIDRQPVATPLSDAFLAGRPTGPAASVEGRLHHHLRVWERLARRMESGWSPSGRYREDLFRRDLEARDELARLAGEAGGTCADALRSVVGRLDRVVLEHTEPEGDAAARADERPGRDESAEGWWWHRRPRRIPW